MIYELKLGMRVVVKHIDGSISPERIIGHQYNEKGITTWWITTAPENLSEGILDQYTIETMQQEKMFQQLEF